MDEGRVPTGGAAGTSCMREDRASRPNAPSTYAEDMLFIIVVLGTGASRETRFLFLSLSTAFC